MKRAHLYCLLGAIFVGFIVRIPGIFWGYNFPTGWRGHHIDEYAHVQNTKFLIDPSSPKWMHPYPRGMAAHVAVPVLGLRALMGQRLFENPPEEINIIVAGRVVSVIYGTATIFVLFLVAIRLFQNPRVACYAAWILALGGLHVSQSHFFLSDVPSVFWLLLGSYLLFLDIEAVDSNNLIFLSFAALCFGFAFGLKLTIYILPTLAICTFLRRPRVIRVIQASIFFFAGYVAINFASYSPLDLFRTLKHGVSNPYHVSWLSKIVMYALESPSVFSFPILVISIIGGVSLLKRAFRSKSIRHRNLVLVIFVLPLVIQLGFMGFKLSQFPRHLIPFIPLTSIVAAWSLVKVNNWLQSRNLSPMLVVVPFFLYLSLFIYDGEKVFLDEPRNEAAHWVLENVQTGTQIYWRTPYALEGYEHIHFPEYGRPSYLIIQMNNANHYLSGMGLRNSYPDDYRMVFDGESQTRIEELQAVFKGQSEYLEVARYKEGYFMPDYDLVDNLIGNRSRNYVAEIVIFEKITRGNGNEQD